MKKEITDEMLIDLYNRNFTFREMSDITGYSITTMIKRTRKLIDEGSMQERPRLTRNRTTIYCEKVITLDETNTINKRIITNEDIINLITYGFTESRISSITGLNKEVIKNIVDEYKELTKKTTFERKIDKFKIIDLYNNRFTQNQIYIITGYNSSIINATIHQAIRAGFSEPIPKYSLTKKDKSIIKLYNEFNTIDYISSVVDLDKEEVKNIINNLISINILEQRDTISKIINTTRIDTRIEDDTILRMYNNYISEKAIASYYKVPVNVITKAISRINKRKIIFNDEISRLVLEEKKSIKYTADKLNLPIDIIYRHLKEIVK